MKTYCLKNPDNKQIKITPAEFKLLTVFLRHPQTALSREYLLQQTRGRSCMPYDRSIDVRVAKLRKLLTMQESTNSLFESIRGTGYIFNCYVTVQQSSVLMD